MSDALGRLRSLLGSQARIADALGLTREQVSRIATGKSPEPEYIVAIAELLESLPPKDWPERWSGIEKGRKRT
jgi:transcriptional regulator with XRE-family HTH domain